MDYNQLEHIRHISGYAHVRLSEWIRKQPQEFREMIGMAIAERYVIPNPYYKGQ